MPCIKERISCQKIKLMACIREGMQPWVSILTSRSNFSCNELVNMQLEYEDIPNRIPDFYKDLIATWGKLKMKEKRPTPDEPLCYNS